MIIVMSPEDECQTGQVKGDMLPVMHRHAVDQRGPQAGYEPLQPSAPNLVPVDCLHHLIAPALGLLVAADKRGFALPALRLVLRLPGVFGNEVVHRLGVHGELLVEQPFLPLQLTGVGDPLLE